MKRICNSSMMVTHDPGFTDPRTGRDPEEGQGRFSSSYNRLILHVDADAFYASVEQVLRPELKGRAVVVGGSDRGVVSAASYEARKYGVHSAMPVVQARRLCPRAVFLDPNFEAYKEYSRGMFDIMRKYSPAVEATSIDEGYVDLTGTLRLHKAPPWEVSHRMLAEIRSALGINVSGGLAGTKTAAKMATGLAKPNGLLFLDPDKSAGVLGFLPVHAIPGVGKHAHDILERHGISQVRDLASAPRPLLKSLMGVWGEKLLDVALDYDSRPVRTEPRELQKSYSKERTLAKDTLDYSYVRHMARQMAEKLAARLREDNRGACTVTFKVRYSDFKDTSRSMSLAQPTNSNAEILWCLDRLFWKAITRRARIRQVGVKLSGIDQPSNQMDLFDSKRINAQRLDSAVDAVRRKFGFDSLRASGWS